MCSPRTRFRLLLFGLLVLLVGYAAFLRVSGNWLYALGQEFDGGVFEALGQSLIAEAGRRGCAEAQEFLSQHGSAERKRLWLERLAAGGNGAAQRQLASWLEQNGEIDPCRYWYRMLGLTGDLQAQWKLVGLYKDHPGRQLYWARKAAQQGLPEAQQTLGLLLLGLDQPAEALDWLKQAADKGLMEAQRQTALLLEKNSPSEAAAYWRAAAQSGDAESQMRLGLLLADRLNTPQEALSWLVKAADKGLCVAQKKAALIHLQQGALEDAARYFEMAAAQGDKESQLRVGLLLAGASDKKPALNWLTKAADFPEAQLALGLMLMREGNRDGEAEPWLRRAAELGVAKAQLALATLLIRNSATPSQEAVALVQKAAAHGLAEAKYLQAMLLQESARGSETEKRMRKLLEEAAVGGSMPAKIKLARMLSAAGDIERAIELYLEAAKHGDNGACAHVGMLYLRNGQTGMAEKWLDQAARKGDAAAANNLGMLLSSIGRQEQGRAWLRQAASGGLTAAQKNLARLLAEGGSPKELEEASQWMRRAAARDKEAQLAAAWMAAHPPVGERDLQTAITFLRAALFSEMHGLDCWQQAAPDATASVFVHPRYQQCLFWVNTRECLFRRSLVCASLERGDYARAVALCRAGIKDQFCALALATCYALGQGVHQDGMSALGCVFAAEEMPASCSFGLVSTFSELLRLPLDKIQIAGARQLARQSGNL